MFSFLKRLFRAPAARPPADTETTPGSVAGQARAERNLRRSEEHFQQLVAGVRDYAIFLLDQGGHVLTWNAGAERIKWFRAGDIIGQHFSRFYPKEAVSSGWPAHELKVAAATGRFEDEGWRVRKDGSRFWANVVITALRDDAGHVRGFLKITRDLTDRKQAEEKLRLSEERFRLLVEGVRDYAVFMLDPEGRVATWNPGARRMKGYTADEIIGQHFSRFYPKEAVERGWPQEELRRAAAEGRFEDEGWRVRKDGSRFWANVVISAVRDETGVLRGFAKVTRDLTQQREAEENARRLAVEEAARKAAEASAAAMERQREQLRVTLASIGDGVIVTDVNGAVTFMNPVATGLTGWAEAEAAGQPLEHVFRIVHDQTRQPSESPVRKALRERAVVGLENHTALLTRDGREVPVEDSAAPILTSDGAVTGVVLVFRDMTERKRSEQAVRASEQRFRTLAESIPQLVWTARPDGHIEWYNRRWYEYTGTTPEEVEGWGWERVHDPAVLPQVLERWKRSLATGEPFNMVFPIRGADGIFRPFLTRVVPVREPGGRILQWFGTNTDISEQQAMEEALREEDRRKTRFLAVLAHELRNPLAPLRSGLEVMRMADGDRQTAEQARAMMERQLQHLVRLVDDLLDVSRINRGMLYLQKERLDVAAVVAAAVEMCEPILTQNQDQLTVTLPDEPVLVDADRARLAQVLYNLLSNAVKYSDRGSRIRLSAERGGTGVVLRVKDNGIGIPAPMLSRVFGMFTQVDPSLEKSRGGLGVGLHLVKRLVEMHGGTVEARSDGPGKGSEFVVRLPIADGGRRMADSESARGAQLPTPPQRPTAGVAATDNPQSAIRNPQSDQPASRNQPARRVLVVDDNVDGAESLALMLTLLGHDVRTAHNGLEGVDVAASFHPHVIFMDIGMPGLNGYNACRRIRGQPWGKGIAIIALTGWGQAEERRRSEEAGFDRHLVKPVELRALEDVLAGVAARA
jgi:PAS domain S-box-containing protein